jgi:UDP-glucose 4-epimerase
MKILITGGAGFIGSHLVENLVKLKHDVIVLDNLSTGRLENIKHLLHKIKFIKCDISSNYNFFKYFKSVDKVFHIAALADIVPSIEDPYQYFNANVKGTLNIVKACRKYKVKKLVYTASSSCYGIPENYPTSENEKISNEYPYAFTKNIGEQIILHWSKVYNLNVTSIRLFNVYGTRSRTSGTYGAMFGVFLAQKLAKKPFTVVGNGKQKRDFTYVSDVVDALILASKFKKNSGVFNVGSGKPVTVNYIVKLLGGKVTYIPKRPGEPPITHANIRKVKKHLKWKPKISIEEGVNILKKNISYWKKAKVWSPKQIKFATKSWFKYLK